MSDFLSLSRYLRASSLSRLVIIAGSMYHRFPSAAIEARLPLTHDVFGRERHVSDRDDMGGVGCLSRPGKTLYIGGLQVRLMGNGVGGILDLGGNVT